MARSTLCALFHRTAEQLALIYEEMKRVVRRGRYVNADETTQRILAPEECFKGWMWTILSRQAIVYHYSDHRDSETAKELLGGTTGNLTSDGYSAYSCLSDKEAFRNRSGCWGHYPELDVIWSHSSRAAVFGFRMWQALGITKGPTTTRGRSGASRTVASARSACGRGRHASRRPEALCASSRDSC